MAAQLGETKDPLELVPGKVGSVADAMWALREYGDALLEAGEGLKRIDTSDGWSGKAADQFRDVFDGEPTKWLMAGDAFHDAAKALDSYANTLHWAQSEASEAIRLWGEGEADTARAKAEHQRAAQQEQQHANEQTAAGTPTTPRDIPFDDPGKSKRDAAEHKLKTARSQLSSAGDTAADKVGAARDKAPEKPGFWSKVGDIASKAGEGLLHAGEEVVTDLASFGNAMLQHPGDTAAMVGGIALTAVSGAGEGLGGMLDVTGAGAVVGVPLNVVSAAGMATGVAMTSAAAADLAQHAGGEDKVSLSEEGSSEAPVGRKGTKTDRLKEHLTEKDLDAARRELDGEVVARKSDGTPWDHVNEVREAQDGLVNRIERIKRQLNDSRISDGEKQSLQSELSEASKLLDHSEGYVPRTKK
ncbi:putative T7SS-secreted protein [Streptomyces sp. NPDC057555]|uniref:putative T7SS-secreted protein n=1 Tax=Streptomyces sp. NPDC057555 TaxID=3346166 RepID=UPI00368D8C61